MTITKTDDTVGSGLTDFINKTGEELNGFISGTGEILTDLGTLTKQIVHAISHPVPLLISGSLLYIIVTRLSTK